MRRRRRNRTRSMTHVEPVLPLGLPFAQTAVSEDWFDWPTLPDLFPVSFPGVKTGRDPFLVDTDLDRLKRRLADYFDACVESRRDCAALSRCDEGPRRDSTLVRYATRCSNAAGRLSDGFIRFAYRPFDNRWLYWEAETKLLRRKVAPTTSRMCSRATVWLSAAQHLRKGAGEPQACLHESISVHGI